MRLKEVILIMLAITFATMAFAQTPEAPPKSVVMEQNEQLKKQIDQLKAESWQYRTQAEMRESELLYNRKESLAALEQKLLSEVPPGDLPAPAPEKKPNASLWKSEVEVGGALSRGNRRTSQGTLAFASKRATDSDNLQLNAYGELAQEDGETKGQVARGTAEYRHDINKVYYWMLAASIEHDRVSKVNYRATVGPGLGQYFVRAANIELTGEVGPAYFAEQMEGDGVAHSVRLRAAQELWWQILKPLRFFERAELLEDFDYAANRLLNIEAGFESSITEQLSLRLTVRDRFQGMPAQDVQKNDISFITSAVWGF